MTSFFYPDIAGSGGGAVSSVTNSDGSITVSPSTGAVVVSLSTGHINTWTNNQIFSSGFQTDIFTSISGSPITIGNGLVPNNDNLYPLGSVGDRFSEVRAVNFYGDLSGDQGNLTTGLNLPNQGTSHIRWQGNSHRVDWVLGTNSGSDQTWTWPGDYGSGGVFQIDNAGNITIGAVATPALGPVLDAGNDAGGRNIINTGDIYPASDNVYASGGSMNRWSFVYANFFVGDGSGLTGIPVPAINAVISAGSNAGGGGITGLGSLIPDTDNTFTCGGGTFRWSDVWAYFLHADYLLPPSGELNFGGTSSDTWRWTGGDTGGTPSNTVTPSKWIFVRDGVGSNYYMPLYAA